MKKIYLTAIAFALFVLPQQALACVTCNRPLQESIFNDSLFSNILSMLAPLSLALLAGGIVNYTAGRTGNFYNNTGEPPTGPGSERPLTVRPLVGAAIVLGIGMGGFVDGIVFHQILQWHQMLSNQIAPVTLPAKNLNMFWDGIFHAFTWLVTLIGIVRLFKLTGRKEVVRSASALAGGLLVGWALFNIAEGLVDHYILKLHNVRENVANSQLYNHAFTIFSFVLLAAGLGLITRGKRIAGLR